jgi:hypothetical protein
MDISTEPSQSKWIPYWVIYKINSTTATKNIVLRCLAIDDQGKIEIHLDTKVVKDISIGF